MPYEIHENNGQYEVVNKDSGSVKAKHTTRDKAEAQVRLLHAVEHGYKPPKE